MQSVPGNLDLLHCWNTIRRLGSPFLLLDALPDRTTWPTTGINIVRDEGCNGRNKQKRQMQHKKRMQHRDTPKDPIENKVVVEIGEASKIGLLISFGLGTFGSVSNRGAGMCVAIGCRM